MRVANVTGHNGSGWVYADLGAFPLASRLLIRYWLHPSYLHTPPHKITFPLPPELTRDS